MSDVLGRPKNILKFRSLPLVIQRGDDFVIIDGHHRLAAQWLMGADRAPVWLVRE